MDVAFYPQINEFRGLRSVQLQVVDLRRAMTRAQLEQSIYEKYRRGTSSRRWGPVPAAHPGGVCLPVAVSEAPERRTPILRDTVPRIAREAARSSGRRSCPPIPWCAWRVMEEQGAAHAGPAVRAAGDHSAPAGAQRWI